MNIFIQYFMLQWRPCHLSSINLDKVYTLFYFAILSKSNIALYRQPDESRGV